MCYRSRRMSAVRFDNERSPFFGRLEEMSLALRALAQGARIVTVLGPGGSGKTRFAERCVELASLQKPERKAVFVDLTEALDRNDVLSAMARALSVRAPPMVPGGSLEEQISAALESGSLLVVLDNAEPVVGIVAACVRTWTSANTVQFLVTSRVPLALRGEQRIELGPLDREDAISLLLYGGSLVRGNWQPTHTERQSLAAIADRVDCLPLALEISAARLELFSPAELYSRLSRSFDVLTQERADAPERHLAMRTVFDGTWQLLTPREGRALSLLSVFLGGFSIDAALFVLSPRLGENAVLVLAKLRRLCLIVSPRQVSIAETRLTMYETVRTFASEKLEASGEREAAELAHAEYFATLGQELAQFEHGIDAPADLHRLEVEKHNLLAVHQRFAKTKPELAMQTLSSLYPLCIARGPIASLEGLLASAESVSDPRLASRLLCMRAHLARLGGAPISTTEADLVLAADRARADCPSEHADALRTRAMLYIDRGSFDEAVSLCKEAIHILSVCPAPKLEARIRRITLLAHLQRHALAEAETEGQAALLLHRASGDVQGEASTLIYLASARDEAGDAAGAIELAGRSLSLSREAGNLRPVGIAAMLLAATYWEQGDAERAETLRKEALAALTACKDERNIAFLEAYEGLHRALSADLTGAQSLFAKAASFFSTFGNSFNTGVFSAFSAAVEARLGHVEEATRKVAALRGAAPGSRTNQTALALVEGCLFLAKARIHLRGGERTVARELVECARQRPLQGGTRAVEIRFLQRFFDQMFADVAQALPQDAHGPSLGSPPTETPLSIAATLSVAHNAEQFSVSDGVPVSLARRDPLRRILLALVVHHHKDPESPVSSEDLVEAGWPSEHIQAEAGQARLYTAVRTLRKFGLMGILVTRGRGYLIAPGTVVTRAKSAAGRPPEKA